MTLQLSLQSQRPLKGQGEKPQTLSLCLGALITLWW